MIVTAHEEVKALYHVRLPELHLLRRLMDDVADVSHLLVGRVDALANANVKHREVRSVQVLNAYSRASVVQREQSAPRS